MRASGDADVQKKAALFSLLADPTRLLILRAINVTGGANVRAICENVGMSQSAVSHQLHSLSRAKVVVAGKKGRVVTYALAPTAVGTRVRRLLRFK